MTLAQTIKQKRVEKKLTQTQLGFILNLSKAAIAHHESGRCEPDFKRLAILADVLGFSLDELAMKTRLDQYNGHQAV